MVGGKIICQKCVDKLLREAEKEWVPLGLEEE